MNAIAAINTATANLPATYENARRALAECSAVDECKDWADKAAALASYAKQAEDDQLERMAQRIRARAIRRAGELAKQLMQPVGRPSDNVDAGDNISRAEIKERSGFSDRQLTTALRIANVPESDFERQVESPKPPTLTQLASQGIQRRDPPPPDPQTWLKGRDKKAFNRALHFTGDITDYAATAAKWDLSVLADLDDEQRREIRVALQRIDAIHDQIATRI